MEEVNMEDIPIPIPVSIPVYKKFEENNSEISLYVYEWHNQNECLEFRYVSERRGDEYKQVNLLVISTKEERSHYCIIKDLHKLVYNHSKHKGRKYLCRYCLHIYSSEIKYNEYLPKCKGLNNTPQRSQMPVKNKKNEVNPHRKITDAQAVGPDALERFVTKIEKELANIQKDLSVPAEMIMALRDLKVYNEVTECWICKGPFLKPAPEIVQKLKEAKHNLLEIKE
ncbi:hypothetical protein RhiirA1_476120 [Rhizophagus irregularis]|uniref:Uncharacterized protein n=1 Tax=Rhizophagus irregularis TaxID=588596 RepID=A0A2N0QVP7_9GLOM|nr:hypothetical protein RhiirA1_476120 [Rhizophagus irregularis]